MAINSKIILAEGIKLDKEYKNVLTYTETQLLTLMRDNNHLVYEASNYSFIDEFQNIINVQVPYQDCIMVNYMAFQNPRYNNKWFFCFIDKVEYNSEKSTNITFHIDSWATWYENIQFKNCYVIREHVSDDSIGLHTVDEGLPVGDVISQESDTQAGLGNYYHIGILSNWNPDTKTGYDGITMYNRTVFGSRLCVFPYYLTDQLIQVLYFILQTNADRSPEDIKEIFMFPADLVEANQLQLHQYDVVIGGQTIVEDAYYYTLPFSYDAKTYNWDVNKTLSFTDYQPANNKLFCYPYNYLYGTNNIGDSNIYKYEDFRSASKATFTVQLAMSVGCSGRLVPYEYKNVTENIDESIALGKYPVCQWSSDSYTNWLTQNGVNIRNSFINMGLQLAGAGANASLGALTATANTNLAGNLGSSGIGTLASIASQMASLAGQFDKAELLPNRVNGANTGDVNFASNDNTFKLIHMRAKSEYLKIIDDYFSRFGYKILRVKTPEINSRRYWNYVEIGQGETLANGYIPQNDLDIINKVAQRGFTIWHDHDNIGNYYLANSIVTP